MKMIGARLDLLENGNWQHSIFPIFCVKRSKQRKPYQEHVLVLLLLLPNMATSPPSTKPQKGNRYTLFALSLLLFFLFCLFFFTRKVLEPNLSLYRDLLSLTPIPITPPRSIQFKDKSDASKHPNSSQSDSVDVNTTIVSESEFQEEAKVPISSKSDLDDKTAQITAAPVVSSEPGSRDNFDEITAVPISSNEKIISPISSKSDLDEKTRGDLKFLGGNEKSSEGAISNVIVEKLRNCDIYKGTWVKDEGYPLYKPGSCPYVDDGFDCQRNGRPDSGYLKWRWKPDECELPRFTVLNILIK